MNKALKDQIMQGAKFRHACKLFDDTKKISQEDMNFILEIGRMSPSSFGMEAWKFLVITNEDLKAKIRPFCWNQVQVTSCSHLVVLLAAIENVKVESGIPRKRFERREGPKEKIDTYMNVYAEHLKDTLSTDEKIYSWTARQTYIAAGNMMNAAGMLGIDSCPIEGFDKDGVETVLGLDTSKFQLALVLPFGYRVNAQPEHIRLPFDEVVEFIK
ncbi:MAG: NAD(P)H-dependent oxidoreductase [Sulfurospirillaceae bacterium]|nr:NAD(P)H-dependent oxidoreductase [Sulfurospirillaceae bacterium]